jgi:hypothetical protein
MNPAISWKTLNDIPRKETTHPFVPSLSREGKPEGRGEFKPVQVSGIESSLIKNPRITK